MPKVWGIFRVNNCRHTIPHKLKFVFIVCEDIECMGFLVNKGIGRFISQRPSMLQCQVVLKKADYHFLFNDSYLDCSQLYPFDDEELAIQIGQVLDETKQEIKEVVSQAKTIPELYRNLISNS
jgi:hypothetical protein